VVLTGTGVIKMVSIKSNSMLKIASIQKAIRCAVNHAFTTLVNITHLLCLYPTLLQDSLLAKQWHMIILA